MDLNLLEYKRDWNYGSTSDMRYTASEYPSDHGARNTSQLVSEVRRLLGRASEWGCGGRVSTFSKTKGGFSDQARPMIHDGMLHRSLYGFHDIIDLWHVDIDNHCVAISGLLSTVILSVMIYLFQYIMAVFRTRTLMKNRLNFIMNVGSDAVNGVNYRNKTSRRLVAGGNMDLYSLEKFKKYKKDWNYPVQVRNQEKKVPEKKFTDFQTAIKTIVIVGQFFGLNPVLGVSENDAAKLRFKINSWLCAYTFMSLLGQIGMASVLIASLFTSSPTSVDVANSIIFYVLGWITTALFLRIAILWPKFCMEISQMEATDPTADSKLRIKFNVWASVILALAFVEHILSELHGMALGIDCEPELPFYEAFIRHSFPWLYEFIPFNNFFGALSHIINIQCSFNWNFTDLFVICMSVYLTSRFEQINHRIIVAKDKNSPPSSWRTLREDYTKTTQLVRRVDNIIGGLIFISFASSLFFICSQLLHTLAGGNRSTARCKEDGTPDRRFMHGYEHPIYFAFSFVFLVGRSLAVSLSASKVHLVSLEPTFALHDVSSSTYCVEVERFLDQIHGNTVALTGLQFFNVKRGLILTIAGTIVTYELVLMQFTGVTPAPTPP